MNPHYTYFLILAASLSGPLILSFDKKVAFYRNWKPLFTAMVIPALLYIGWDIYFTAKGVWLFNPDYITGIKLVNLPVEEVLFFVVVPYCCVFIYACVRAYFPKLVNNKAADVFLQGTAVVLLCTGLLFLNRQYTSSTFILNSLFIFAVYLFRGFFKFFDAVSFLVSYAICLIPFLLVNGLLTALPVVIYNDDQNLGFRIYTIPFEDVFYGMLLIMMNIVLYEKIKNR